MPTTLKQTEPTYTRYKVEGVEPENLDRIWWLVEGWLYGALKRGDALIRPKQVKQCLIERSAMLWIVIAENEIIAALVIRKHLSERSLEVWLLGGEDFLGWAPTVSSLLKRYAQENGLRKVECYARPGIGRGLRKLNLGWRHVQDVWAMRIDDDGR